MKRSYSNMSWDGAGGHSSRNGDDHRRESRRGNAYHDDRDRPPDDRRAYNNHSRGGYAYDDRHEGYNRGGDDRRGTHGYGGDRDNRGRGRHQDRDRYSHYGNSERQGSQHSFYGDRGGREEDRNSYYGSHSQRHSHYGNNGGDRHSDGRDSYYGSHTHSNYGYGGHHGSRNDGSERGIEDRRRGGRGGDRRGSGRGGGRGRGRGGNSRVPDMSNLTSCLTNVMETDISENFQFFMYSVCAESPSGVIDSRHRRLFLFSLGLWDGLLKDMPTKEKTDLRRVVFFQGSFFYSARKIPGLEPDKLPLELPLTSDADGDTFKVIQVFHYVTPVELTGKTIREPTKDGEIKFDLRCNDCSKCFTDSGAMIQHCQQAGHAPAYAPEYNANQGCKPTPAHMEMFTAYVNGALQRALGERLARWGSEYIDPANMTEPSDRNGRSLGVRVYEAYSCQFGFLRNEADELPRVGLTVDLRAKIVRTMSVLDHLASSIRQDPGRYNPSRSDQEQARREFIGEVVISMHDKTCYSVQDLLFHESASTLMVSGLGMSHAEYFSKRKNIELRYPDARPMIAVLGRRNQTIYLPPELAAGNELEARVKQQLPMIASYKPDSRNRAIEKIRCYLIPGAQKSKGAGGLLPALGIQLANGRLSATARVLPIPMLQAAGVKIPQTKGQNWASLLKQAKFNINPKESNKMKVIVFHHRSIRDKGPFTVFQKIRDMVNQYKTTYRFSDEPMQMITAGDKEDHWRAVEKVFNDRSLNPENVFVLDFNRPKGGSDPAYPVIKQMLTKSGFLSQFVNFNTYDHASNKDPGKSEIILGGVARQILQKAGFRLWWVKIPESLPTPTVFVGVDVFHAPRVYDPKTKKRIAKASCAAIIVQVFRNNGGNQPNQIELYSKTYARESGKEYELGDALKETVAEAMEELNVSPASCIVWRDGIGDSALNNEAQDEIKAIRDGLNKGQGGEATRDVPLSYIVAQKRIATKFLSQGIDGEPDGKYGVPSGTLIKGVQNVAYETFYLNGRSPPYSTAKPVRFVVVKKDGRLEKVPIEELTWHLCHDYANWTGPIKVPSVTQMAHKLAELGGSFGDCGNSINAKKLKNKIHFL